MLQVIYSVRSTNQKWGLDIVSRSIRSTEKGVFILPDGTETNRPQVAVTDQGEIGAIRVIRIEHDPAMASWLAIDGHVISGGTTLVKMDLQSGRSITISALGPIAVVANYGPSGYGPQLTFLIREGLDCCELSPEQLTTLGLIQEGEEHGLSPSLRYSMGLLPEKPCIVRTIPAPLDPRLAEAIQANLGPAMTPIEENEQ